jgi:hypothetical protein
MDLLNSLQIQLLYINNITINITGITIWTAEVRLPAEARNLFSTASRPALGPTQPLVQMVAGAPSWDVKRLGRSAEHLPPPSAQIKNSSSWYAEKQLYLHQKHYNFSIRYSS